MSVLPDTDTVYVYEWQDTITLAIAQTSSGRDIFAKMNLSVKDAEDLIQQLQDCITLNNYKGI